MKIYARGYANKMANGDLQNTLYTVGHSNQSLEEFLSLLQKHAITAVADVRSYPYSKMNPQFNRETLSKELKECGIAYVFLGKQLGARSEDPSCYVEGKVQFAPAPHPRRPSKLAEK